MSEMTTVEIKGLDELQHNLERLSKEVSAKVLKETLKEQGNVVAAAFIGAAPTETGFLAEHFDVKMHVEREDIAGSAFIGPKKTNYPFRGKTFRFMKKKFGRTVAVATVARYLEFGTSKMAAHPFMRPAWEFIQGAVLDGIIAAIKSKLQEFDK